VNFQGKSYWVSDYSQGKNTAVKFAVGNYSFLIVDAESTPCTDGDIAWMTGLFGNYSAQDYNIIFATHALLACDGSWDNGLSNNPAYQDPTWEINLENLLNNHTRVFMTLNGHSCDDQGTAYHNVVNGRVQIQFDRQGADDEQGACSVRIYTFNLDNQTVNVSTYSVWSGTWLTDPDDCFSFSTNLVQDPSVSISPTSAIMYVGQSQTFVSSVLGGAPPYTYQWVLNDTAVSGAIGSNWTFCAKQVGNYRVYLNVTDSSGQRIQSNVASDIHVCSVNLLLIAGTNASAFKKGQSATLEVEVLNQMNPALLSTLTLTVTGPSNCCYYDFQPINVTANAVSEYSFTWNIPNVSGTYVVAVGLAPAQLRAYDAAWLRVT
jgi:hypothetical protein